ncbi:methyltransferase domain-containing protein [Pseudoscourfieldia marina]
MLSQHVGTIPQIYQQTRDSAGCPQPANISQSLNPSPTTLGRDPLATQINSLQLPSNFTAANDTVNAASLALPVVSTTAPPALNVNVNTGNMGNGTMGSMVHAANLAAMLQTNMAAHLPPQFAAALPMMPPHILQALAQAAATMPQPPTLPAPPAAPAPAPPTLALSIFPPIFSSKLAGLIFSSAGNLLSKTLNCNGLVDVLDLMQDDDEQRYTPVTVTESQAATIPAEPSTAISGKVAGEFRSFEDARAYVRALGLRSYYKWWEWRKSGARPQDIPSSPHVTYASSGWTSFGDFLGYADSQQARKPVQGTDPSRGYRHRGQGRTKKSSKFRSFEDARAYVRTLGLKSNEKWREWSKSGKRPHYIPSHPDVTYASSGWISYPDFLGYADSQQARKTKESSKFRSFEDARAYVRTLGLKSNEKWREWSKSGKRPHDIPSHPDVTYASSGWISYPDFLGYADSQQARKLRAVTGAYKRNAAAAGLRALLDGADNDEKGEQDEDDDHARRRKQAKRPRGG